MNSKKWIIFILCAFVPLTLNAQKYSKILEVTLTRKGVSEYALREVRNVVQANVTYKIPAAVPSVNAASFATVSALPPSFYLTTTMPQVANYSQTLAAIKAAPVAEVHKPLISDFAWRTYQGLRIFGSGSLNEDELAALGKETGHDIPARYNQVLKQTQRLVSRIKPLLEEQMQHPEETTISPKAAEVYLQEIQATTATAKNLVNAMTKTPKELNTMLYDLHTLENYFCTLLGKPRTDKSLLILPVKPVAAHTPSSYELEGELFVPEVEGVKLISYEDLQVLAFRSSHNPHIAGESLIPTEKGVFEEQFLNEEGKEIASYTYMRYISLLKSFESFFKDMNGVFTEQLSHPGKVMIQTEVAKKYLSSAEELSQIAEEMVGRYMLEEPAELTEALEGLRISENYLCKVLGKPLPLGRSVVYPY